MTENEFIFPINKVLNNPSVIASIENDGFSDHSASVFFIHWLGDKQKKNVDKKRILWQKKPEIILVFSLTFTSVKFLWSYHLLFVSTATNKNKFMHPSNPYKYTHTKSPVEKSFFLFFV